MPHQPNKRVPRVPSPRPPAAALRASVLRLAALVSGSVLPAVLLVACQTQSRIETLDRFSVDLKWDRPGEVVLEVDVVESRREGEVVTMSLGATAGVELQRVVRRFEVVPSVERSGSSRPEASPVELDRLAQRAIRDHYPQLAANADADARPASIEVGDAYIEVDGRATMARVLLAVDPDDARMEGASVDRLPARIDSVRLIAAGDPENVMLAGVPLEDPGVGGGFDFDLSRLGEGRCSDLAAMLRGEARVEVSATVRRRGRSQTVTTSVESPSLLAALSEAARAQLIRLAEGGLESDLSLTPAREFVGLVHGDPLPGAYITNVSSRPVILGSLMIYRVEFGDETAVYDRRVEPVDCLCPGDRIELPPPSGSTDPCLPDVDRASGLRYVVRTTRGPEREFFRMQFPNEGGMPIQARSFGRFEILPLGASDEPVVGAEDLGGEGASDLRLLLRRADGSEIAVPFPDLPPGGRASVSLPGDLSADAAETWDRWCREAAVGEGGAMVELELLETWRGDCDDAVPARQRLRLPAR